MKLVIIIVFILLFNGMEVSEPERILWNESVKLSWSDFKGAPKKSANFVASTNSGMSFSYSYSLRNGEISYEFSNESFFYPETSWYKKGEVSDYILQHEQTHFDISELHSRILKKRLEEKVFSKNIKVEVKRLYETVESERIEMQSRYDLETDHSQSEEAEYRWRQFVENQLEKHDPWK